MRISRWRKLGSDGGCGLTRLYLNCRLIVGHFIYGGKLDEICNCKGFQDKARCGMEKS